MRFLHTADWHIGKKLQGYDLIEDQRHVLSSILDIAKEEKVEAIVIAGDLYDRSVPAVDAVELYNELMVDWNFFLTLNQLQRDYILKMTISERSSKR